MHCDTVRKGVNCSFMTKKGCSFTGGRCLTVVDKCQGCNRTSSLEDGIYCLVAATPASKWSNGDCNFATHLEKKKVEEAQKINPLKASKRAAAAKK
ncbi:MAG: PxxKW family cysteine-rich protein [Syntrophaceae bacterium]|nr:PxxKW family cysteine-rich protein [Syntrophaceae bacterium]